MQLHHIFSQLPAESRMHAEHALLVPQVRHFLEAVKSAIDKEQLAVRPDDPKLQQVIQRSCNERDLVNQMITLIVNLQNEREQMK